jgi:hypothetical protein
MTTPSTSFWRELATPAQTAQLAESARERRWPLALLLVGWLHLVAFSACYYLTIVQDYHQPVGYLSIWVSEFLGMGLIFWLCTGPRRSDRSSTLERFIVRVWAAYFVLAFNLCSMNSLRGHKMFEFFPAMASLASFAFLVMTFAVCRKFFAAVLIMFVSGLLMAAYLLHAYMIFAVAWWLVLNAIGVALWHQAPAHARPVPTGQARSDSPPARRTSAATASAAAGDAPRAT